MKHKYTDEEIQTAIDEACNTTTNPSHTNLDIRTTCQGWQREAHARLDLLKSALDKLPEPQPPTADGKTPGQVLYEILKTTNIAWGELAEWSREDIKDAAQAFLAAAREGFGPAAVDWKSRHDELQKAYAGHADVTAALHAKVQKAEAELADLRKDNAHLRAACDIFQDGSMSTLRPIAEAGEVPAWCVRLTGARNDAGTWELAEAPATSFDTHCADFYLPDEAKTPAAETFEAHGKTWNSHTPGDPMPCDGERMVDVYTRLNKQLGDWYSSPELGSYWCWYSTNIIGWRYADEPTPAEPVKPWTPAVGDVVTNSNPIQDMALGGQMYWRDLARQLAEVWWKCHNIGASLQHGDVDSDVSFSVVCEKHGGQVFHADTPYNAWLKAEKWLMSPDRENFTIATPQPAKGEQP